MYILFIPLQSGALLKALQRAPVLFVNQTGNVIWAERQEASCQNVCREGGLKDGEE